MQITLNPLLFYLLALAAAWCLLAVFLWRKESARIAREIAARIHAQLTGKSWRTTSLGLICTAIGIWDLKHEVEMNHWFTVLSVSDTLHYMTMPLLALIAGWALIHAKDHRSKD
jgi:hypothetical protein